MKNGRPDGPKKEHPSGFQLKTLWAAITGASLLGIGVMTVYCISVVTRVLQFLQPVLVPVAFAGILAYLLQPLVDKLAKRGLPRFRAMLWVWIIFHLTLLLLFLAVAVPTVSKGGRLIATRSGDWAQNVGGFVSKTLEAVDRMADRFTLIGQKPAIPESGPGMAPVEHPKTPAPLSPAPPVLDQAVPVTETGTTPEGTAPGGTRDPIPPVVSPANPDKATEDSTDPVSTKQSAARFTKWVTDHSGDISQRVATFLGNSLQGFLGLFGYLVGFVLIPVYLYYFMKEADSIKKNWSDYVPLRSSKFKAEVVSTLGEINNYLIAFFRGQMLVSMIDGLLVGLCLTIIGLPYAMLIGIFVAILGLIPYVGNLMCWLAAVLISIAHFGRTGVDAAGHVYLINTFAGIQNLWAYPVLVSVLFVVVQQINSLVTAPRIVGDAVGLHPLTVIFSVLFWSLLIGGLLGALLAVPLTASVKVLFRRYIWERQVQHRYTGKGRELPPMAG
ncbi:MAG: AI-2E family transporter [Verrucomicrobiaceae bacterium]|nr:MAG: AI-2E family transporter [Verrucomicrobiaceae bacterium]